MVFVPFSTLKTLGNVSCITWVILMVLIGGTLKVHSYAFDSIASLKRLVDQDSWLVDNVQQYLVREEERLNQVQEQLKRITSWSTVKESLSEKDWETYLTDIVEHPVNALNLIKDWGRLTRLATQNTFNDVFEAAEGRGISIPIGDDYQGALEALIRLQKTYKIPTHDLAMGIIRNSTSMFGMSTQDLFEMGKLAMQVEHGMAISWFELFLEEESSDINDETVALMSIMEIYDKASDFERAWITANKIHVKDPSNPGIIEQMNGFLQKIEIQKKQGHLAQQHFFWKNEKDRSLENYEALCRGEYANNNIFTNKDLMCVYRNGILPYIQYKEEIHSFSPRISLFIDVISDRQADMLKTMAYPGLFRAQVGGDASITVITNERVGKLNWLWDTDVGVKMMSDKVSDITGLSTEYNMDLSHSEAFQIVNYGMGGQYEPHYDYYEDVTLLSKLPSFIMGTGDRISTFMFYLSDVTAGGATVFPSINVHIPPIKNAAAFWYNFNLAGEMGDKRTLHAGCPVLLGQKWVGNKWIRQEGQHFKRRCDLDRDAVDPIWYS